MISFRFHIVSLTAVFLALAIGVVVGTTYVDRAVVDSLENRVDRVSDNLDQRKAENDALERDLREVRAYVGASADFAVTGRLTDVPVLVLALRGVDGDVAGATVDLLRRAGAATPGITWVEERLALGGDGDRAALAAAIGAPGGSRRRLQTDAVAALVAALGVPAEGTAADPTAIGALVDAGFLSVDARGEGAPELVSLAGQAPRVLLLTGAGVAEPLAPLLAVLATQASDAGLATVAADAFAPTKDGPGRGEAILEALPDELRDHVAVVDDVESPEGRVAAVLALVEVAEGRTGHFGYGSGADGVLPAWTAP